MEELNDMADPNHQLQGEYRTIAGLEGGWRWATLQGDTQTAGRLSAAILHYSVLTSQNLSAEAQKALYNGDLQKSVDYTNQALAAIPDGRNIKVALSPDGKTVSVTGSSLTGQQLWQKYGSAAEVLERATAAGKDGKLQWDALESQAAKYDSTFAGMQRARQSNFTQGAREDTIAAKEKAKEDAANAEADRETAAFNKMYPNQAPANVPAAAPPATQPAPTGKPPSGTTITANNAPPARLRPLQRPR